MAEEAEEVRAVCARLVLLVTMHFEFFDTMRKHDHLSLIDKVYFSELGIFGYRPCQLVLPHEEQTSTKPIKQ